MDQYQQLSFADVEHVFRHIKIRFGLSKNAAQLIFLTVIANVLRGDSYKRRTSSRLEFENRPRNELVFEKNRLV
jgi:hypothetical protein